MSAHTPGPWQWRKRDFDPSFALFGADGKEVADDGSAWSEYGQSIDPASPDARLIAAAPELLHALEELLAAYVAAMKEGNDFPGRPWTPERDSDEDALRAQQVIAKARGLQP